MKRIPAGDLLASAFVGAVCFLILAAGLFVLLAP